MSSPGNRAYRKCDRSRDSFGHEWSGLSSNNLPFSRFWAIPPCQQDLLFLPTALVFLVVEGSLSARFVTRFGKKLVLISSMVLLALSFLLPSRITLSTPYFSDLLPSILFASFAAALAFTAFNIAALSGARQGEEGFGPCQHLNPSRRSGRFGDSSHNR
ncbi:MAG: hypothetical protein ACRECH_12725 [Nitrososphaerales archaeon]